MPVALECGMVPPRERIQQVNVSEMRRRITAILDAVEDGETFVITRRGVPVAELRPMFTEGSVPTEDVRTSLVGLPRVDYAALRAEADAFFGTEDRALDEGSDPWMRFAGMVSSGSPNSSTTIDDVVYEVDD